MYSPSLDLPSTRWWVWASTACRQRHFFDQLEQAFADRQAPLRFELASLGEPEIMKVLTRRGYQLIGFENVLGLRLHERMVHALADDRGEVTVSQAAVGGIGARGSIR